MDSMAKLFTERVKNEMKIAEILFRISEDKKEKKDFDIKENMTFYSGAIAHAYYCILYSVKAILTTKNIKTSAPEIHKKTLTLSKNIL